MALSMGECPCCIRDNSYHCVCFKIVFTSGVNKNGIAIIGFNTTGNLNVTISVDK